MKTMPWQKHTTKQAMFERCLNSFRGMRGYRARRFSLNTKNRDIREPKITRQITCGEFHGNVAPPNSSPSKSMRVSARIDRLPNQSMALKPSITGVLGLWTSKNISNKKNVIPQIGRFIQKLHLQETFSVKKPPRTGPTPPAIAQITSNNPK